MFRFRRRAPKLFGAPDPWGPDYLPDFERLLRANFPGPTGNVLEWGAGFSTRAALPILRETGCKLFLCIDHNAEYLDRMLRELDAADFFTATCQSLVGPREGQVDPESNYSTYPLSLGCKFDFIYIDGRRRMECAFIAALLSHATTTVVLHDYRRGRYQPIVALFDVIEDGGQFRVMRRRPEIGEAMDARFAEIVESTRRAPAPAQG
jgi:hypothetical protein